MVEWFTWIQFAVALIAGLACIGAGLIGQEPNDWHVAALAIAWVPLVIDAVMAIVGPAMGNAIQGDGLEFWMYVIVAIIIPPAAVFWALIERTKWSTVIIGGAALTIAVMMVRMQQIWSGVPPLLS